MVTGASIVGRSIVGRSIIGIAVGSLLIAVAPSVQAAAQARVTICHRTMSATNPYVRITVAESSVDGTGGAGDHFATHAADIIPPIEGVHGGLNWTAEGIAIYAAGCRPAKVADTDRDGVIDVVDPDDDNDSIPDVSDTDDDGDGVDDSVDPDKGLKNDTDGDGVPDALDPDDDGDGISDATDPDVPRRDVPGAHDRDGDCVSDALDDDDDGDGIPDATDTDVDNDGTPNGADLDDDNDGIPDAVDDDVDGDGTPNAFDAPEPVGPEAIVVGIEQDRTDQEVTVRAACRPSKGSAVIDTDGDGQTDATDPDDDDDGIPDSRDRDRDGDGQPDATDSDDDGDGVPDAVDPDTRDREIPTLIKTDTDGDGIPDVTDRDDDGDGVPDARDADADGHGIPDTVVQTVTKRKVLVPVVQGREGVLLARGARTNAGQPVWVTVRCAPGTTSMRLRGPSVPAGDARLCDVTRSANGRVTVSLRSAGPVRAFVEYTAPAVGEYRAFVETDEIELG